MKNKLLKIFWRILHRYEECGTKRNLLQCRLFDYERDKDIVAHHLKLFSEFPELRFSVDNGIVLCRSCHKKIHKDIFEQMVKRDTVLCLQFYPITPIGFYRIYHYDYDELIKQAKYILTTHP